MEAVASLKSDIESICLRVIGEGEDLEALRRRVVDLGIQDRVEFLGRIPWADVRDAQTDAWVGVNAPLPDVLGSLSFSNKVVEWVTLGLPVIASRTPTILRYFPEGTLSYVDGGSVESLAGALRELHDSGKQNTRARIRRSQAALEKIAWPVQRDALLDLAGTLVERR